MAQVLDAAQRWPPAAADQPPPRMLASRFRRASNCRRRDIEALRRLLTASRSQLAADELHFSAPDYERMMRDDWLVSRFLLRGYKRARAASGASPQESGSESSSESSWDSDSDLEADERRQDQQQHPHIHQDGPGRCREPNRRQRDHKSNRKCSSRGSGAANQQALAATLQLVQSCAQFRFRHRLSALTGAAEFPAAWLAAQGVLQHGQDRAGNPVVYLRCRLHRPAELAAPGARLLFKRMLLWELERADQRLEAGRGLVLVLDLSGLQRQNLDLELAAWMAASFRAHSPKLLAYALVYNLPWLFSAAFRLLSGSLASAAGSVRFVRGQELLSYVERARLPAYLSDL